MEHASIVSDVAGNPEVSRGAWDRLTPTALAARICAGCVYDVQPRDTVGLLVTRADPRARRRGSRPLAPVHAHWPLFAPSVRLLTGHETACQSRCCHGIRRCLGHEPVHLGWAAFAAAYRLELEQWPLHTRLAVARHVAAWLRAAPTVTVLSFEQQMPAGSPPDCWAQRHVFRDWLRTLLPLALPLGATEQAEECAARGGMSRRSA